ncbi:TonB-dependent receptor [Parahaliea mediterranea]|uniref:TonB-dependent receptor n=1 Tax=Parahaliea mediterranea TaxID=651086 RepID=UPI0019D44D0A|nr:TonB-dependent receptor [Parahaliea mediterranea]
MNASFPGKPAPGNSLPGSPLPARPRTLARAIALLTLPLGSVAAQAQGNEVLPLETVIVTAQRYEQSVNDVGMDIQAYQGERLEQLRLDDVDDLTAVVPSFTVAQSYQGVPTYTLRGVGFNTINMSATSTVGTYVDEVAYPYPILNAGPMFDMARVEVLKGPQGTLFGRNTTAGLINLVTNKPTEDFEAMVQAEVGNYDTFNQEAMISGALFDGLQARLSIRNEDSNEGWQEAMDRSETLGEVHRTGVRAALAFQPTDRLGIDFAYNGWRDTSDTLAAQAIGFTPATTPGGGGQPSLFNEPGLADYVANNRPKNAEDANWVSAAKRGADIGIGAGLGGDLENDSSLDAYKLNIDWELNDDLRLVALTGYQDFERQALSDWSGAPFEILVQDAYGTIESFSQELRLEGSTENTRWMVGAYYAEDEILDANRTLLGDNANSNMISVITSTLLGTPFNSFGYTVEDALQSFRTYRDSANIDSTTKSVFASVDWDLADSLTLTTGIRYSEDEQDYNGCSSDVNGSMLPNVNITNRALFLQTYGAFVDPIGPNECNTFNPETLSFGTVESELDEDNVAWRVVANWTPTVDTLYYASVSQGTKAGVTPVNAANISTQNAPAKQEELLAYELGVKAALFSQRMQFNASAFYYDYTDKQLSVYFADPIYTALSRINNVPDSEAYGLDAEITFAVTNHLTAIVGGTLLRTEVQDYQGIDAAGQPADFDGKHFLYSPEAAGSLTLIYDRPISEGLGMSLTLNGRYQDESYGNLANDDDHKIDSYGLFNATAALYSLDERWNVSLWGANLTDEYYWLAVATNANTAVRFPGRSMTYGASFTYRF